VPLKFRLAGVDIPQYVSGSEVVLNLRKHLANFVFDGLGVLGIA
ncbi:uncharacterized protein METZ01_LOCUS454450, partial [marine metagenome]